MSANTKQRRKVRRNVSVGVAHVKATFNNTTITITDTKGDVICWASSGTSGFKGSRKSTPFAGQLSAAQAAEKAITCGMKEVDVKVRGPGSGREDYNHRAGAERVKDQVNRGRYAAAAQRLPAEEASPRVEELGGGGVWGGRRGGPPPPPPPRVGSRSAGNDYWVSPVCRLCRREGTKLFLKGSRCDTPKCAVERRQSAPGMSTGRRGKPTEYSEHLREKQKVKRYYGVMERQFRKYFDLASRGKGNTGDALMVLLERRLDNVVHRMGLGQSRGTCSLSVTVT